MNALDLLKTDHRVVDMLFMQAQDAPPSKAEAIFTKIRNELEPHAHVEETIFYPKMKKEGNKELQKIILEGYEEHSQIKKFLFELAKMSAKSETFQPKLKVLVEDTRHHVKEEESEMFSLIEDQF
jgi:iron-sulfur cluster repair protein YtfE (RIC family)